MSPVDRLLAYDDGAGNWVLCATASGIAVCGALFAKGSVSAAEAWEAMRSKEKNVYVYRLPTKLAVSYVLRGDPVAAYDLATGSRETSVNAEELDVALYG